MRRAPDIFKPNAGRFEVIIRAPTLGLVTRVPGDQPDPRAATAASNVRFDDGVIRNAPGCAPVILDAALDSPINLFFQASVAPADNFIANLSSILIATSRKLYALSSLLESNVDLTPETVVEFLGDVRSAAMLRQVPMADKSMPRLFVISVADDAQVWKLRPRLTSDADDGAGILFPVDYGFQTNNVALERIG